MHGFKRTGKEVQPMEHGEREFSVYKGGGLIVKIWEGARGYKYGIVYFENHTVLPVFETSRHITTIQDFLSELWQWVDKFDFSTIKDVETMKENYFQVFEIVKPLYTKYRQTAF